MNLTGFLNASAVRSIAAEWHGGQASPLYALASSGAIVEGCDREVNACRLLATTPTDVAELTDLLTFVRTTGERGPVPGWAEVTIR